MLLPLGARLRTGLRGLLGRLVDLREIILVYLRPWRLLLRLRWEEGRRGGNRRRRGLRKRCGRIREIGDRSRAEVREVRNGLETIGDGSQRGQEGKCGGHIPRHQLIQQNLALVFGVWALNDVCPLSIGRSRRSGDLGGCLLDGLGLLGLLWLHDGHQRWSNVHRGVAGGTGHGAQKRKQDVCRVVRWGRSSGRRVGTAAWDGVERARGSRSRV